MTKAPRPKQPQRAKTVPRGLVLSATGGDAFFWSGTEMVHVPRARHDSEGYYRLIGVPPDADDAELKEAAKKRLMEAHPDHGGSEDEFVEVYRAYRTLTDPSARAEYDARPPATAFSVEVALAPERVEIGPVAPPRGARTAYYKEPDMVMSDEDETEVDAWAQYVLEAAQVRRIRMQVEVGIRKRVERQYAIETERIFMIESGRKAQKYMAHVLMALFEKQQRERGTI